MEPPSKNRRRLQTGRTERPMTACHVLVDTYGCGEERFQQAVAETNGVARRLG